LPQPPNGVAGRAPLINWKLVGKGKKRKKEEGRIEKFKK